ncbi:MAG: hypothetical protein HDR02_06540 [Lachnospiraceae bacterium]|nr:hypothetical protein [Lachnospiraceae bacterium]
MEIEKRLAFCFCIYISAFYCVHFTYDYNYWVLLMLLLIMDLLLRQEIKGKRQGRIRWFIIGTVAGCAVLAKQSTGLAVFVATSIMVWIFGPDRRKVLCYIAGCMMPVVLCFGWLLQFHIWETFWNYAFDGINMFRQYNRVSFWTFLFHSGLLCTVEAGLAIIIMVEGIRKLVQGRGMQAQKKWLVIFGLSVAGMTVVYPIADDTHFVIALLPFLILGICELPLISACQQKLSLRLVVMIAVMGMGVSLWSVRDENVVWSELAHYQGIRMDRSIEQMVQEVNSYLQQYSGTSVYILDGAAMLYKIPMGRYDKDYDMCLAGNWGDKTSDEMAQALLQRGGIMLLAADGYGINWQVPEEFIEYIKYHASCVDHIGKYDVYIAEEHLPGQRPEIFRTSKRP